ncbi:MAG: hypothetical protein EU541_04130 [Promethearchaeota archaeon]|nr:MAG: hypothetical protein EU541_04130 [Candidatus Lokiarchaeota archaeon]
MLRQIHILYKNQRIFSHTFALALGTEELNTLLDTLESNVTMSMPGKINHRPISENQVFHKGSGDFYFILIVDLIDKIDFVEDILNKIISKFEGLFQDLNTFNESDSLKKEFISYIYELQSELHSKIAIIGPINAGKTILYKMLTNETKERSIMNFAKSSTLSLYDLTFDVWDFQLKDNFALLWQKFITGSDLIILVVDASKYNLKILNHFLSLTTKYGKLSKFLILINKIDLVDDTEDIKELKKEVDKFDTLEISLLNSSAKEKIFKTITKKLRIKEKLPNNFEELIEEAKRFENQRNLAKALASYKQLVRIANKYQYFSYINEFEEKVRKLDERLKERSRIRKRMEQKKKFAPPKKIKFKKNVNVKSLNTKKATTPKPEVRSRLKPSDIKIDLTALQNTQKRISELSNKRNETESNPEEQYDSIDEVPDLSVLLQEMIESRGSGLSLKLCSQYIEEMLDSINRKLNIDDLKVAVEHFIQLEKY